jgi:hypothetical protein
MRLLNTSLAPEVLVRSHIPNHHWFDHSTGSALFSTILRLFLETEWKVTSVVAVRAIAPNRLGSTKAGAEDTDFRSKDAFHFVFVTLALNKTNLWWYDEHVSLSDLHLCSVRSTSADRTTELDRRLHYHIDLHLLSFLIELRLACSWLNSRTKSNLALLEL